MYKALSQALTGKAFDSGAYGSFAPPVHTMQDWWNQVYRQSTWFFRGQIICVTCYHHRYPRHFSRRCTM